MIERYSRPEISAIWTDENKFRKMLDVEILACEAMAEKGIIPKEAAVELREKGDFDLKRINEIEKTTNHDVVAFIKSISEKAPGASRFVHFGLTSSDVLDTALSVMMVEAADIILRDLDELLAAIKEKALKHKNTPMMGRSHGVHAEPITLGLKLALYYKETQRNIDRMKEARKQVAVGKISGSVGTFANIDPFVEKYVCKKLGLAPAGVSSQIIQRDRHAHYMSAIAIIGATLEKIAVEVRGLQKTEIGELQEGFAKGQTGSSSMPHKKNPIICERVTGLARVLRSNAMAAMENVALWHERDISHSSVERIIIPDSTILLDYILSKMTNLVSGLVVNEQKMRENIEITGGHIYSQHLLLELIKKGLTRVEAYDIAQELALKSYDEGVSFTETVMGSAKVKKYLTDAELKECFSLEYHFRHIDDIFKNIGLK